MEKPQGYDDVNAKSFGLINKPKAGAYVMKILKAEMTTSSTNRPMLCLGLDIAQGEYINNFKIMFSKMLEKNPSAKYPCVHRRCTDGNQLEYFKGDIKSIEESNQGFKFNFDEKTLNGKLVGCMLREKAIGTNKDGSIKTVLEPMFLCSVAKALSGDLKPPEIKYEQNNNGFNQQTNNSQSVEEDLPF